MWDELVSFTIVSSALLEQAPNPIAQNLMSKGATKLNEKRDRKKAVLSRCVISALEKLCRCSIITHTYTQTQKNTHYIEITETLHYFLFHVLAEYSIIFY